MVGITIMKNLPKCCDDCDLCYESDDYLNNVCYWCAPLAELIVNCENVLEDCPLIEIK